MEHACLDKLDTIIALLRQMTGEQDGAPTAPAAKRGGDFLKEAEAELRRRLGADSEGKRWFDRQLRLVYRLPGDLAKQFPKAAGEDIAWFAGVLAQSLANGAAKAREK